MPDRIRPPGVLGTTTRLVYPVVLLFAGEHIVNAAQGPGEGFSAGLLVALAVLLLYVGLGYRPVARAVPAFGRWGTISGLGLVLLVGALGIVLGDGFLAGIGFDLRVGEETFHLSTHLLFDVAIFLVVASSALSMFRAIGLREEVP